MTGFDSKKKAALDEDGMYLVHHTKRKDDDDDIQVYKRPWVDLTEHELFSIWMSVPDETEDRFAFARAVLAKSKELNT
jgi:hypothetical protein